MPENKKENPKEPQFAHPETMVEILELREQVDQQAKSLLTLALRILVDLTYAQAFLSYCLFYRHPWLFASFENKIDAMTRKHTNYWYTYIMGSFIKTINNNLSRPFPPTASLNKIFSEAGQTYGVQPVDLWPVIKQISTTQKALSFDSLVPATQNVIISWIKKTVNNLDQLNFDDQLNDQILSSPLINTIHYVKHNIFVPQLSDEERNNLPLLYNIVAQAKSMATALGHRSSMRIYWFIHAAVVQVVMQTCFYYTVIPTLNYLLSLYNRYSAALPHSNNQARQQLSALKQQHTLQSCIALLCYAYFFYRAVKTIFLLLELPNASRLKNLDLNLLGQVKNVEFSALCTILFALYQLINKKIAEYNKPAARLKAINKLNEAIACINGGKWRIALLGFNVQRIIIFDATANETLSKEDIINIIIHACIKHNLGVLHTSENQVAIKDELFSDKQYQAFKFTVTALLQKYRQLQSLQSNFTYINKALINSNIIAKVSFMEKVSTPDGNIQWHAYFTVCPQYVSDINHVRETFELLFTGYRIDSHNNTLIVKGDKNINNNMVDKNIQYLVSKLAENTKKETECYDNNMRYLQQAPLSNRKIHKNTDQPSSTREELCDSSLVKTNEKIIISFSSEHIYNSNDTYCRIKPLSVPWAPDNTFFVSVTKDLEEELSSPAFKSLLENPHFVSSEGYQGITINKLSDRNGFTSPFKVKFLGNQYGDLRVTCSKAGFFQTPEGAILCVFNTVNSHRDLKLASK